MATECFFFFRCALPFFIHLLLGNVTVIDGPVTLNMGEMAITIKDFAVDTATIPPFQLDLKANTFSLNLEAPLPIQLALETDFLFGSMVPLAGTLALMGGLQLKPVGGSGCHSASVEFGDCSLALNVSLELGGLPITGKMNLCDLLGPLIADSSLLTPLTPLRNQTLHAGSLPMSEVALFRAMRNIATDVDNVMGINPSADFISDTVTFANLILPQATTLQKKMSQDDIQRGVAELKTTILPLLGNPAFTVPPLGEPGTIQLIVEAITRILPNMTVLTETAPSPASDFLDVFVWVPEGSGLSTDVIATDTRCRDRGLHCTVPADRGLYLTNTYLHGFGNLDLVLSNGVLPSLISLVNTMIADMLRGPKRSTYDRVELPMKAESRTETPPIPVMVVCPIAFVIATVVILVVNVRRQRTRQIFTVNGPISTTRVLLEDGLMCVLVFSCTLGMIFSVSTTVAEVIIGRTIPVHTFSLWSSITQLWGAGLQPLAVFIFIFSAVYPFVKLLCLLVCTVILWRPTSRILRIIDFLGKFALLDTFLMIVMTAGLAIPYVAVVHLLAPYYIFLCSALASIAVGNYACHGWRYRTSLRLPTEVIHAQRAAKETSNAPSYWTAMYLSSRVQWIVSIPVAMVVLGLTLPSFLTTVLRYTAGGLVSMLIPRERDFNLYTLAELAGWSNIVVILFTCAVAPVLYCLFYPRGGVLAPWISTDALLLAVVGGLLQLNQFLQFVLGDVSSSLYAVTAHLRWPLILLLVTVLIVWFLAMAHIFQLFPLVRRRLYQDDATLREPSNQKGDLDFNREMQEFANEGKSPKRPSTETTEGQL